MAGFLSQIPALILAACVAIVVLFLMFLARMLAETGDVRRHCRRFTEALRRLFPSTEITRRQGIALEELERIRGKAARWDSRSREWWARLEGALEPYTTPDGRQGWFLTRPVEELLPPETTVEHYYHASFHQSVPGILTGLGLLATFISILVALAGVTVQITGGTETVLGIGTLINGLAGKFLSSIIALLLAFIFTLVEKKWCERRLTLAHEEMAATARGVLPLLSATRVLLDLEELSMRRTLALERIYAEIVERLADSFRKTLAPALAESLAADLAARLRGDPAPAAAAEEIVEGRP